MNTTHYQYRTGYSLFQVKATFAEPQNIPTESDRNHKYPLKVNCRFSYCISTDSNSACERTREYYEAQGIECASVALTEPHTTKNSDLKRRPKPHEVLGFQEGILSSHQQHTGVITMSQTITEGALDNVVHATIEALAKEGVSLDSDEMGILNSKLESFLTDHVEVEVTN